MAAELHSTLEPAVAVAAFRHRRHLGRPPNLRHLVEFRPPCVFCCQAAGRWDLVRVVAVEDAHSDAANRMTGALAGT